jgi:chromosome segregation protein
MCGVASVLDEPIAPPPEGPTRALPVRLKQLKLAGFKSFVDPISFEVPSQLVGVVGPNGCGKSNIMDAVRWVLGESRATELRGESMQDVIFNGSSDRKPSVRASVELVFDNASSRLGGAWSGYAEISVKRTLSRDGQSAYLINHQVVRRKDVHDMFLGTGLGPRAYAIIGQGMVSRIVEARPEDLRVFLEEAAGVSKYKERRRETENRLADTRDNLNRVEDILRELGGQIDKLERQAAVAREYRTLEARREAAQRMLWILRRDEAAALQAQLARQLAQVANEIESQLAQQRAIEARLEQTRAAHYETGEAVHAAQGACYEATAEVTRLEDQIRFVGESQAQLKERLAALHRQIAAAREQDRLATEALGRGDEALAAAEQRQAMLAQRLDEASAGLPASEDALRDAREALDAARARAAETAQEIQVAATRQRGIEETIRGLREREQRLRDAHTRLGEVPKAQLDALRLRLAEAEALEERAGGRVAEGEARWTEFDARRAPAQDALRESLAQVAQVEARIGALRQIQERVRTTGKTVPWLQRHGLEGMRRLWQRLRVEPGWEAAIEAVLRERVQALEVGRIEPLFGLLDERPPAKVGFYAISDAPLAGGVPAPAGLLPLGAQVHTTDPQLRALLDDWLHGSFCSDTAAQALADRSRLPVAGQFVLRSGHAIGRFGVQLYALDSEQDGLLARQQELDSLTREQRALELIADEARASAARTEAAASEARQRLSADRDALQQAVRTAAALRLETERCAQQVQRASADRTRLDGELAEILAQLGERVTALAEETARFEGLDLELADRQEAVEAWRIGWEDADAALGDLRERLRELERDEREASYSVREIAARRQSLRMQIDQARGSIDQGLAEVGTLEARLAALSDAAARAGLQDALEARVRAERGLAEARARLDALTASMRGLDEARLGHERAQQPLRARLTELQLEEQAARIGAAQFAEQLAQAEVDEVAVRAAFEQAPRASWLQGELTRLGNALAALGAVNLAALEELTASRERHDFLTAQLADLNEAIQTLEDAIRKIDRETRSLLQETFDAVNGHFGTLFPELFGGGEARLVLTGEEILDSGVSVVAQPPGKRNQSIHLLSGGEKALTAIALVFAIFQLNPAPFCLLDEVDAPLDDANTERYCTMVKRMSGQTQFLFITHKKITMELAQQLVGVTMQERGVSRIVAVDLQEVTGLAKAA